MDFEEFEGFKKIPNKKHINIEEIYDVLENYRESIGEMSYLMNLDDSDILIDIKGKYNAKIYLTDDDIVIERIIEDGFVDDSPDAFENGKSIPLAHADRVIEQLYDLIRDYLDDGVITEHITRAKKILKLTQEDKTRVFNAVPISDNFVVTEYTNDQNILYTIKENILTKNYVVRNEKSKRDVLTITYEGKVASKFTISKQPLEIINLYKEQDSVKTLLKGTIKGKELKISADYSDNHYLVEYDEIVIGAVDCLDIHLKTDYRLEINDEKYEDIIIAIAIISDNMSRAEKKGV